jgi:hypothetical protein
MRLLDGEITFLDKRKRFVRSWRYVGPGLVCLIAALGVWLFVRHPLLANPAHVVAELQRGGLDQKTIEFMAVLLPIAIGLLVFLGFFLVLLGFASFANERKYLEIISRETLDTGQMPGNSLQERRP